MGILIKKFKKGLSQYHSLEVDGKEIPHVRDIHLHLVVGEPPIVSTEIIAFDDQDIELPENTQLNITVFVMTDTLVDITEHGSGKKYLAIRRPKRIQEGFKKDSTEVKGE